MRQVEVSNVFERNYLSRAKYLVNRGGARSTKSWSIAQLLIMRFWNLPKRKILVTRKTGPALHLTAYKLVVELLQEYGYYRYLVHDKTYNTITNPANGSIFCFLSIDDPEKIKSTDWNDVWMEEATEFDWDDFVMCQTRLSSPTTEEHPNQIIISFNPTDPNGWIENKLVEGPSFKGKVEVIHSTYRDNPFLGQDYIELLKGLADQDPGAFKVFAEGEYAQITGIIYENYTVIPSFPDSFDEVIYGLDFGFNNPTALVRVGVKDLRNCYLEEKIYRTNLTNSDLIELMREVIPESERDHPIYADCAEPNRIEELCRAGFNCHPAEKDVKDGIDFCKRQKFYSLASNVNLNKERASYKWRCDKNGNPLDEPVKFLDHIMDAKRYALFSHFKDRIRDDAVMVTVI